MSSRAFALLAGLVLALGCTRAEPAEAPRPRRVVLVVLDSVRADRVGAVSHGLALTPRLDALAARGLAFERAYAASSFGPQALSALWTGRLPSAGASTGIEAVPHPELITLPRLFLRAGFRTALASNHAGLRPRAFTHGFDALEIDSQTGRWSAEDVTRKALELVDGAAGEALFLVVNYADAGEPHEPPEALRARIDVPAPEQPLTLSELRARAGELPHDLTLAPAFRDLVARYDAEVARVDQALGALVDGLAARAALEETLLVVTASHGVEFLEHGYVGSGWTLHEEVLRVPLVVCTPGNPTPARIAAPVSVSALWASFARLLGRTGEDDGALFELTPGRLAPAVPPESVLAELVLPELCVLRASIQARTKLIEGIQSAAPGERAAWLMGHQERRASILRGEAQACDPLGPARWRAFFDLESDPGEHRALTTLASDRLTGLAAALAREVQRWRASELAPIASAPPPEEPESDGLDELRQIGYL